MVDYVHGRSPSDRIFFAYKTSDESVTSSTALQDDNHLAGIPLFQSSVYALEGCLHFDATSSAGQGMIIDLTSSANWGDESCLAVHGVDGGGNVQADVGVGSTSISAISPSSFTAFSESSNPILTLHGILYGNGSSDATLKLRWAQAVSSGTAITLKAGSWIKLTRLN